MVYVFGSLGLIAGFSAGIFIIRLFLKDYSRRDLLNDKSLRWTYGLAVWILAAMGCWAGIWFYKSSFLQF